jgi:hypothetical protein
MVCVTLILEAVEYVALNYPSFHNVCSEIMLFDLFIPKLPELDRLLNRSTQKTGIESEPKKNWIKKPITKNT